MADPKPRRKAVKENVPLYQIKVELLGTKPVIWRRILVRSDVNLGMLHAIVQLTMGWTNSHLHHFFVDNTRYSDPELEDGDWGFEGEEKPMNEREHAICDVVRPGHFEIKYEYDFGDSWEHILAIERLEKESAGFQGFALCMAGERACPPEDCGGISGVANLLETIKHPNHAEYEETMEWLGGRYNPDAFDVAKVNKCLKKLKWEHPSIDQLGKILAARDGYKE